MSGIGGEGACVKTRSGQDARRQALENRVVELDDVVGMIKIGDGIKARIHLIERREEDKAVAPRKSAELVEAQTAIDQIIALPALQRVVTDTAKQAVISRRPGCQVVAVVQ